MDHSPLIKAAVAIVLPVHQCEIFLVISDYHRMLPSSLIITGD